MEGTISLTPIRYLVDEEGHRESVVINLRDYELLQRALTDDPDLLIGMSETELRGLAEGMLSLSYQERLDALLQANRAGDLSKQEAAELQDLLDMVDVMNTLKARALYTLDCLAQSLV